MKTASFIISYNRPEVLSYDIMKAAGLNDNVFVVVDDEEPCLSKYEEKFGNKLVKFHKPDYAWVDSCDLKPDLNSGEIAKSATHEIAKQMGLDAYCVMDDDITKLKYRNYDQNHVLKTYECCRFDEVFKAIFEYMVGVAPKIVLGFIMSGRMFPGRLERFERFCSHITFRRTKDDFALNQRYYDDLGEVISNNRTGAMHFSFPYITYDAMAFGMQNNKGGSYESYVATNDYERHFQLVIVNPDRPLLCEPDKRTGVRFNRPMASHYAHILREEHKKR